MSDECKAGDARTEPSSHGTRRGFLRGTATALAAFAAPALITRSDAHAACSRQAVPFSRRLTPDFSRARIIENIARVRPHRNGGVRLERVAPDGSGAAKKFLIHNYGHGGGGITLSWGCASVVGDHVEKIIDEQRGTAWRPHVAVIGSGVIGLTVASELQRRNPRLAITIYDKDLDHKKSCSWAAGGQFEPSGIWREYKTPEAERALKTYLVRSQARLTALRSEGQAAVHGISRRDNYTLVWGSDGLDKCVDLGLIPCPQRGRLPFSRLRDDGLVYKTWLINPRIMLPKLIADLARAGVARKQKRFSSISDVYALPETIIVNCTGLGAGQICGDPNVHPIKGQLVILKNTSVERLNYFFSGGCGDDVAYMFCRSTDIVIGGTWERGVDNTATPESVATGILDLMSGIFNGETAGCLPPMRRP